jgi:hypothetical protein
MIYRWWSPGWCNVYPHTVVWLSRGCNLHHKLFMLSPTSHEMFLWQNWICHQNSLNLCSFGDFWLPTQFPWIVKLGSQCVIQRFISTVTLCALVPNFVWRYAESIWSSAWTITVYLVNSLLLVTHSKFCYLFQQEFCAPSPHCNWPLQDSTAICPNWPLTWPVVSDSCVWLTLLLGTNPTGYNTFTFQQLVQTH